VHRSTHRLTLPEGKPRWLASFAFALPSEAALREIADAAPGGVIEVGAGTGYWARLLHDRGVDVVAVDLAPPPSPDNVWFAGVEPWFPVRVGDETAVDGHPDRALLLVWPTRNEDWPADAAGRFAAAGGRTLAFVGEAVGGRTGDDRLHAVLGELDRCWSCAYGVTTAACVCGIRPAWRRTATVPLPDGTDSADELRLYARDDSSPPLAPTPPRSPRRRWLLSRRARGGRPARP
jgi:hypothetical protein